MFNFFQVFFRFLARPFRSLKVFAGSNGGDDPDEPGWSWEDIERWIEEIKKQLLKEIKKFYKDRGKEIPEDLDWIIEFILVVLLILLILVAIRYIAQFLFWLILLVLLLIIVLWEVLKDKEEDSDWFFDRILYNLLYKRLKRLLIWLKKFLKRIFRGKGKFLIWEFHDGARSRMNEILYFYDWLLLFLLSILAVTRGVALITCLTKFTHRKLVEAQSVENIWAFLPTLVLIAIGIPSLGLLYFVDDSVNSLMMVKAVGNQWYWQYDYPSRPAYESYLSTSHYRLLDSDHRLSLQVRSSISLLITAADVLHSWTVPSMGTKADAIPGRVNKLSLFPTRPGVFFGQCSEICGSNHRFIPIAVECYFNLEIALKAISKTVKSRRNEKQTWEYRCTPPSLPGYPRETYLSWLLPPIGRNTWKNDTCKVED